MVVGTLLIALRLPSRTLKDKRRVVRGLIESARKRFGVSAAEVDDLGLSGNATIGVAFVSASKPQVEATLATVLEYVEAHAEIEVFDVCREIDVR